MKKQTLIYLTLFMVLIFGAYFLNIKSNTKNVAIENVATSTEVILKNGQIYNLTASYVTKTLAGKTQKMLGYNGEIPGPTLRVNQGDEITINFKNNTDLPALLHSHGVRMDSAYDGAQTSQKDIAPGKSFVYKLKFPDAGVYWYHPHANEVYEQPLGLYGAFIVSPKDPNYFPPVNKELPLFLSDLAVNGIGDFTIKADSKDHVLMGRYGRVQLVNGQENYLLDVKSGEVVRFYVINSAGARPFNFAISGAKLKVVGGDNGAFEKAFMADSVVLGPAERAVVDVLFSKSGDYAIQNKNPMETYNLGKIMVSNEVASSSFVDDFKILQENKTVTESIDPYRSLFAKMPDKKIKIGVTISGDMGMHTNPNGSTMGNHGMNMSGMGDMAGMMHGTNDGIEWEDNMSMMGRLTTEDVKWKITDVATELSNMDIQWNFKKDVPVKIEIFNDPKSQHPMQHPIHFHGNRFLVVSRNGVAETNLVWKDTTLVKADETIDIILDTSNIGTWMAHCHTAEHLQDGMMFKYEVK